MALPDWLEVAPLSGKGDSELTASAPGHTGRVSRSFIMTGTPSGGEPDTMEIEQEGLDMFVEVSGLPTGGEFNVPSSGGQVVVDGESNAAELVLDSSSDPLPVRSAGLQAAGKAYVLSGMAEAVELTGDPGAAAQYAFKYALLFGERLGRSDGRWYGSVKGSAPEESYAKRSDYFRIIQDGAEDFLTSGSTVSLNIPADGAYTYAFTGESNLLSLSFRRGDSSPWAWGLPMAASIIATGKDSGSVKTVEVAEADTQYDIPDDPGLNEAYSWRLVVTQFPANTGRVVKSGKWLVGSSSVNEVVANIRQASPGEFCDVETNIPSIYTFPKATQGTLSIKGTSNCTNVWLRGLRTADLQNASMYINGSKANEWEGNNTEPGNIYEFRGEDEAYEWEIRVIFPATTDIETIRTYMLGWTTENGTGTRLASFTVNRP